MGESKVKLVSVLEMQAIEREADASGLTYAQMMEIAGLGLAQVVDAEFGHLRAGGVLGLVGSGNNGGDTLVALAYLAEQGWRPVRAYLVRPRPKGDPLLERLIQAGGEVSSFNQESDLERLEEWAHGHAVLLDGVLGTGIRLPLKDEAAAALEKVRQTISERQAAPKVVAVDCPSGIDLDSGEAAPQVIPADLTVTMAAVKIGLLRFPAANLTGKLKVVGIGLEQMNRPLDAWEQVRRDVVEVGLVRQLLPERPLEAHKGTFGTVLVVAGSVNYTGAGLLAGKAAYRAGAGLVTWALPAVLHEAVAGHFPEATWLLLPHEMGVIAEKASEVVQAGLERVTALLVGPGLGLEDETRRFMARLISAKPNRRGGIGFLGSPIKDAVSGEAQLPPLVVDADGLKLLARIVNWAGLLPALAVLTPHPGEMAILTGLETSEIQGDRLAVAERFAQEWGQVVVLKGAFTVVAAPDGRTGVIPVASPALARAGTGDVLAGLIAGLRAQGLEAYPAALAGAWIHAQAGLLAAERLGSSTSVLAGEVLEAIPAVMRTLALKRDRSAPVSLVG